MCEAARSKTEYCLEECPKHHRHQPMSAVISSNGICLVCAKPIYRKRSLLEHVTEALQRRCNTRTTSAAVKAPPNVKAMTSVPSEVLSMEISVNYASDI